MNGYYNRRVTLRDNRRKLVFGVGTTFSRQLAVTLFQLLFTMLLARVLGKENFGLYALALMLPQLFMKLLNLGLGPALVYFIARKDISYRTAFRRILLSTLILSLIGISLELIVIGFFRETVLPGVPRELLLISCWLFPVLLLQELLPNLLLGVERFRAYNASYVVFPLVSLIAAYYLLIQVRPHVNYAIFAFALGQLCAVIWLLWLAIRVGRDYANSSIQSVSWPEMIGYSWKIHASNIIAFLNYRIDIFLINLLAAPAAVGIYFVAVQIVEKLWLLSQAVNTAIFPHLSGKYKRSQSDTSVIEILGTFTFISTGITSLLLLIVSGWLVNILFGIEYEESVSVLIILLPGILANSVGRIISNDFSARGRPVLNVYVGILTVSVNVVANIILIPRIGPQGAAWATTLSYGINFIVKLLIFRNLVNMNPLRVIFSFQASARVARELLRRKVDPK